MSLNFDIKSFMGAAFEPRTMEIDMAKSAISDFFPDGAKKVFVVRGLTAEELAKVREEQSKDLAPLREKLNEAITAGKIGEQLTHAFEVLVGLGSGKPPDFVFWFWIVMGGVVDPQLNIDATLRLSEVAPIEFKQLAEAILTLTGQGQSAKKKLITSGENQESNLA